MKLKPRVIESAVEPGAGAVDTAALLGPAFLPARLVEVGMVRHTIGGEPLMAQRPYYHVLDRMYNVFGLVDRAGAFVERYGYNGYGRPLIRLGAISVQTECLPERAPA